MSVEDSGIGDLIHLLTLLKFLCLVRLRESWREYSNRYHRYYHKCGPRDSESNLQEDLIARGYIIIFNACITSRAWSWPLFHTLKCYESAAKGYLLSSPSANLTSLSHIRDSYIISKHLDQLLGNPARLTWLNSYLRSRVTITRIFTIFWDLTYWKFLSCCSTFVDSSKIIHQIYISSSPQYFWPAKSKISSWVLAMASATNFLGLPTNDPTSQTKLFDMLVHNGGSL